MFSVYSVGMNAIEMYLFYKYYILDTFNDEEV